MTASTAHTLTETENYFGPLRCIAERGTKYHRVYVVRPCEPGEESNHGTGTRWRQHCACGWRGSWARGQNDAINGGRAHVRAARRKEIEAAEIEAHINAKATEAFDQEAAASRAEEEGRGDPYPEEDNEPGEGDVYEPDLPHLGRVDDK